MRERLGADDNALEAAAGTVQRAQERLGALSLQQRSAHLRAVVEAVRERLEDHSVPAIIAWINGLGAVQNIATVPGQAARSGVDRGVSRD